MCSQDKKEAAGTTKRQGNCAPVHGNRIPESSFMRTVTIGFITDRDILPEPLLSFRAIGRTVRIQDSFVARNDTCKMIVYSPRERTANTPTLEPGLTSKLRLSLHLPEQTFRIRAEEGSTVSELHTFIAPRTTPPP